MTAPGAVDLFGISVPDREVAPVNKSRSLIVNILPRSIAPAFAKPLTDAELHELWLQRVHRQAPLPLPLNPEPRVADLPSKLVQRFSPDAVGQDQRLPRWLTRPGDRERETGAQLAPVNNRRQSDGVETVDVACKHVLGHLRAELHLSSNSVDYRQLRAAVKQSARTLFPRKSNVRACGVRRFRGHVEARVKKTDDGKPAAFVNGLVRCGSVWSCPTCAPTISGQRARTVRAVVGAHRAKGGESYLLTLTLRHNVTMPLKALRRTLSKALQKYQQGKGWSLLKERMGFVGTISARECTMGGNGYHPHLHILLALSRPLTPVELEEIETAIFFRWCSALARVTELAGVIPSRARGVMLSVCHAADYIQKLGLAAELTGGAGKKARGENRTPFQVALDWHQSHDGRDARLFRDFSRGMKGARQLTWSRTSAKMLAKGKPETDLRKLYADAIRALTPDEQPSLTGLESDAELMAREEKAGAVVATLAGRQWDALSRVMRAAGVDGEHVLQTAALDDGAHGVESLVAFTYLLGKQLMGERPYLKKWLRWLAPPDPLPALT